MTAQHPHPNRLLAAISPKSRKHLLAESTEVVLVSSHVLHEPALRPDYAFFLTSGLASVLAVTEDGLASEVAVVGREGFIGSLHLIGPTPAPTHCRMQLAGAAVRVPFEHLEEAFHLSEDLHTRILEFVQAQAHTISQIANCHRTHSASQRLTRWLLSAQDRIESSMIDITQETLSEILGTKRVTIAAAAGELKRRKMIRYKRGHINIVNPKALETMACDCYGLTKKLHRELYN